MAEEPCYAEDRNVGDKDSANQAYADVGRFFEARPHTPTEEPEEKFRDLDPGQSPAPARDRAAPQLAGR